MYTVNKTFDFCAGHRVWNQTLNQQLAGDNNCGCKHLHGHNYTLGVTITMDLNERGMVIDYKELAFIKNLLDAWYDHRFIIDRSDPITPLMLPSTCTLIHIKDADIHIVSPGQMHNFPTEFQQLFESFVIVDFVPTSENLAKHFHQIIHARLSAFYQVCKSQIVVSLNETPKTQATYTVTQ